MSERDELENLMGEMAAQADDELVREEIERQIADKPWAQEKWRELLRENDCFRKELKHVETPSDLEARLLSDIVSTPASVTSNPRTGIWIGALATILLVAIGIVFFQSLQNNSRKQTVALLAISNHLDHLEDHGVGALTHQPDELAAELSEIVEFDVLLPNFGERLQLVDGRKCKLGTHTVAFTLWSDKKGYYSLFQFRPSQFGISQTLTPQLVYAKGPAGDEHPCGAWIWTDRSAGYVLVGDPDCEIADLKLESLSER